MELAVGERLPVPRLTLPDERGLVRALALGVLVEAHVEALIWPPVNQRAKGAPLQSGPSRRAQPGELARDPAPEPVGVLDRLAVQPLVLGGVRDARGGAELVGGRKGPRLGEDGLDLIAHGARREVSVEEGTSGVYEGAAQVRSRRPILPAPRWDPGDPARRETAMTTRDTKGYLHGFGEAEEARLRRQARIVEHRIHGTLPFRRCRRLLEVGSGVGAQTEILLRTFPTSTSRVWKPGGQPGRGPPTPGSSALARGPLRRHPRRRERPRLPRGHLRRRVPLLDPEHVGDPARVLSEVRRTLRPGSPFVVNEVQNATFFLSPYSPCTLRYWGAFNDHQFELGGDPFVGAKLGNLLQRVGFSEIETEVRPVLLDNRHPGERAEFLQFWTDLLLSGCEEPSARGRSTRRPSTACRGNSRKSQPIRMLSSSTPSSRPERGRPEVARTAGLSLRHRPERLRGPSRAVAIEMRCLPFRNPGARR